MYLAKMMCNILFSVRSLDCSSSLLSTVIYILKQLQCYKHQKRLWFPYLSSMFSNLAPGNLFCLAMLDSVLPLSQCSHPTVLGVGSNFVPQFDHGLPIKINHTKKSFPVALLTMLFKYVLTFKTVCIPATCTTATNFNSNFLQ